MSDESPYVREDETEPLPLGKWFDDLTWSPSQCYYRLQHNGADYILYLRWRWTDPWQAYVVKNAASLDAMNDGEAVWSGDVFELNQVYCDDRELELAKDKLVSLFYEFEANFKELRQILEEYDENSRRDVDGSFSFLFLQPRFVCEAKNHCPSAQCGLNKSANSCPLPLPRR